VRLARVADKAALPRKRFAAQRTSESLDGRAGQEPCVPPHVLFMTAPVGECSAAAIAQVRPFSGVRPPVPVQAVLPAEPPSAFPALEPLAVVVEPGVDEQIAGPLEGLPAHLALVRTVVRVRPDVSLEAALVRERLVAHETHQRVPAGLRCRRRVPDVRMIRDRFRLNHHRSRLRGTRITTTTITSGLELSVRIAGTTRWKRGRMVFPAVFHHVGPVGEGPAAVDAGIRSLAGVLAEVSDEVAPAGQQLAALRTLAAASQSAAKLPRRRGPLVLVRVVRPGDVVGPGPADTSPRRDPSPSRRTAGTRRDLILSEFGDRLRQIRRGRV